jgi:hypothetical protein
MTEPADRPDDPPVNNSVPDVPSEPANRPSDSPEADGPGAPDGPQTKPADRDARKEGRRGDKRGRPDIPTGEKTPRKMADVINVFQDQVNAGLVGKAEAERARRIQLAARRLDDAEVTAELRYYCPPDGFAEAAERLRDDHVVVICGAAGMGKRAAAINLLREATQERLEVMSAASDLKDLAVRVYRRGCGYLIVNRVETAGSDDYDFTWGTVRDRLRRAGAYLVVTSVMAVDGRVETVRHIGWQRPDLRTMLRGHLVDSDVADDVLDKVVEHASGESSMADLADVARRLGEGSPPEAALEAVVETSARRVREWFDASRDTREILEVAVLAFLEGCTNRELDAERRNLGLAVEKRGGLDPGARGRRKKDGDILPAGRHHRFSEDGLMAVRQVPGRTTDRSVLVFRHPSYRRHVLTELWQRLENPFWNAVADWLAAIVTGHADTRVAAGLALLATVDFDEVEGAYLRRWSEGRFGANGQATAVFVLWWMCFREETMPIALRVAKQWANHGDPEQRWTAAMAYTGELGACDPAHSIKQLWHLIVQSSAGYDQACFAMAVLFETLTTGTGEAGKLLTTLERQLNRPVKRPQDSRIVQRAHRVLAELLVLRENRRRVPATFIYLEKYLKHEPDRIHLVARLWATGIRHRVFRKVVLIALWEGLNRLGQVSEEPRELARQLGEALISTLPADEVSRFYRDFKLIDALKRRRGKSAAESLALVLLDVIERHYGMNRR